MFHPKGQDDSANDKTRNVQQLSLVTKISLPPMESAQECSLIISIKHPYSSQP